MNKPNFMMRLISFVMALLIINGNAYAARTTTYYHVDALGSVVAASNEAGQVVWRKHYAPFGEQLDSAPNKDRIAYTGKPHDSAIGLTYFGARSYDPEIGRFTSVDPVSPAAGNGANFNDYSYARNNPYKFVDPDGRFIWFALVFLVFALTASDAANTPVPNEVPQPVGGAARWALPALVPVPGAAPLRPAAGKVITQEVAEEVAPRGEVVTAEGTANSAQAVRLNRQLASQEIAGGHAFTKHVVELGEFPGIRTRAEFAQVIENTMGGVSKTLSGGRTAYWRSGVVVIRNPAAVDGGTAFVPTNGIKYFEGLK